MQPKKRHYHSSLKSLRKQLLPYEEHVDNIRLIYHLPWKGNKNPCFVLWLLITDLVVWTVFHVVCFQIIVVLWKLLLSCSPVLCLVFAVWRKQLRLKKGEHCVDIRLSYYEGYTILLLFPFMESWFGFWDVLEYAFMLDWLKKKSHSTLLHHLSPYLARTCRYYLFRWSFSFQNTKSAVIGAVISSTQMY